MRSTIMPMVYWTDFRIEPKEAIDRTMALLGDVYAIPAHSISMIFPSNAVPRGPAGLVDAIQYAAELGTQTPSLWQRMNLSQENAEAVAGLKDPWMGEPIEVPLVSDDYVAEGDGLTFELEPLLRLAYLRGHARAKNRTLHFIRLRLDQVEDDMEPTEDDVHEGIGDLFP
jgi:hypothetical protein